MGREMEMEREHRKRDGEKTCREMEREHRKIDGGRT